MTDANHENDERHESDEDVMNGVLAILTAIVRLVADWCLLAARVRTVLTNDLPHIRDEQQKTHDLVVDHIGFCRGRLSADSCPTEPLTLDP